VKRWGIVSGLTLLGALGVLLLRNGVAAEAAKPFEVGKTYRVEYPGAAVDVRVIAAPSATGWATVEITGGRWTTKGRVLLNVNLVATVQEKQEP
jgi:hypothetical protein